jgi:hypothetical protein
MLLSIAKCNCIAPPRRRQLLNSSLYSSINEGRRRHRGWLRREDSNLCISESGRRGPPSQTWRTFLRNHAEAIAESDLSWVRR